MHSLNRLTCFVFVTLLFALAGISAAWGNPVTWTLSGATFNDGGSASGSFVYDADTNTLSNWSVSVGGGNTAAFPPVTYDTTTAASLISGQGTSGVGVMFCIGPTCAGAVRQLRMPMSSPLTNAGGTITINLASPAQAECYNCAPYRQFTAGSLVGTAAPAITSAASAVFTVGSAGTFTVASTGAPVAALSETGTLPSGVTFVDNTDGTATLAGTPGVGTSGTYALTITASNSVAPDATQNFTLTVNESPTITSANSATFQNGVASSFTVTTTGVPAPALSVSGSLPSGVTFTDNGNGTASLSGTSTASGTYNLTIIASNGAAPDATQAFTLVVRAPAVVLSPTPGLTMTGMLVLGLMLMLVVFVTGRKTRHQQ